MLITFFLVLIDLSHPHSFHVNTFTEYHYCNLSFFFFFVVDFYSSVLGLKYKLIRCARLENFKFFHPPHKKINMP